jgi:hypothetical protein
VHKRSLPLKLLPPKITRIVLYKKNKKILTTQSSMYFFFIPLLNIIVNNFYTHFFFFFLQNRLFLYLNIKSVMVAPSWQIKVG